MISLLNCQGPLWLVHWIVCVLCDWFTKLSGSFVIGSLNCLCPLWLVYWIVCVLCDWPTGLPVFFMIGLLDCLCPLWLTYWIVCVLCDWFTGLSLFFVIGSLDCQCFLWLAHWIVCVLCDWFIVLSLSSVIGSLDCVFCDWQEWLLWFWFYDNQLKTGAQKGSKKTLSGYPGRVDFSFGQATFSLSLLDGQWLRQAICRLKFLIQFLEDKVSFRLKGNRVFRWSLMKT